MKQCSLFMTIAMLASLLLTPAHAESYADQIADGGGWTMTASNGRQMTLTLNPDGTGQMRFGLIRRSLNWRESGDSICLAGMPDGERCVTFAPIEGGGFASISGSAADRQMVLRR
ncbi:MAG: hypothetical protein JJ938_17810 [Roseicyclus sp.]|nr:hypothetical protein [Roseicyclus sp.]MBO6626733.1 hypothetical protein [Roseicyclus sp.]